MSIQIPTLTLSNPLPPVASGSEYLDATLYLGTPQNPLLSTGSAYKCAIIAKANGSATGWSTADLHFCVNGSTGSNDFTESAGITHSKMVIKSNTGNIGIGTTNPSCALDVRETKNTGFFTSPTFQVLGSTSFDGSGITNFQCQASEYGRNIVYMT